MTQLPASDVERLAKVADELREVFSERGYRVDVALDADPAFGSGYSRSSLQRDLVIEAILPSLGPAGLDYRPVRGAHEIRLLSGVVDRRFRLLKAKRTSDGGYLIQVNSDSVLALTEGSLFREELWVFAWTIDADGFIADVFIAEVRDYKAGRPGRLILGPVTMLGASGPAPRGFQPGHEGLSDFEDEEGTGDAYGSA
jgi:hypothetical protein